MHCDIVCHYAPKRMVLEWFHNYCLQSEFAQVTLNEITSFMASQEFVNLNLWKFSKLYIEITKQLQQKI